MSDDYTNKIRNALRDAIADAPYKNQHMLLEDRILALLYISGFKIVPVNGDQKPS